MDFKEFTVNVSQFHFFAFKEHNRRLHRLKQIKRKIRPLPRLEINFRKEIEDYVYDDFRIINYNPHPHISGKVAV